MLYKILKEGKFIQNIVFEEYNVYKIINSPSHVQFNEYGMANFFIVKLIYSYTYIKKRYNKSDKI